VQEGDILKKVPMADGPASGPAGLAGRPLAEVERYYIEQALTLTGGKREEAAKMLGIGERTLYRVIKDWDLQEKIKHTLAEHNGDVKAAAQALDMDEAELQRKIKKSGLQDG
jgi:two-component system, NtrC family, response regulator HydG